MSGLGRWVTRSVFAVQANVALFFGMKRRAQELYAQILARYPDDLIARATLANMLAEADEPEAAIAQFDTLLHYHPEHADSWFNLGFLQEKRDRVEDAERSFRRALALDPKLDRAWYGLGLVLIRQQRLTEAVAALKKNTQLQPFSPYGWYQLAMTYHHLGEDAEAWKLQKHLQGFEPKFAAGLKRDLEQTLPRARFIEAADPDRASPAQQNAVQAV